MLSAMTRRRFGSYAHPRVAAATAVLALVAGTVLAACSDGEPSAGSTMPGASASSPGASPSPSPSGPADLQVEVDGPIGLTVAGDALWAVSSEDDAVVRIDPATGQVTQTVEVGDTPLRLAASEDGDLVWVSVFRDGQVRAIDTSTGQVVHEVALDGGPEGVAVGLGAVWVVRQDVARLTRLSDTGEVLGHTPLGEEPRLVAIGSRDVWVSNFGTGTLTRVRRDGTGARTSGEICDGPQGMVVDSGVVWVTCTPGNEVVAVDERTMRVRGRLLLTGEPDGIRLVDRHLWVLTTDGPTLIEVDPDPSTPAELSRVEVGAATPLFDRANVDLAGLNGKLWVSSFGENRIYRVTP